MVRIGRTDPFQPDTPRVASDIVWERSEWAGLLAFIAAGVAMLFFVKWLDEPSDPQWLLYSLVAANATPFVWNQTERKSRTPSESTPKGRIRRLLRFLAEGVLQLAVLPLGWARRHDLPLPEGATWEQIGFGVCYILAAVLIMQVVYRLGYRRYLSLRRRQMAQAVLRETVFPRL